ncbi:hypothetical protein D3C78_1860980 [compost metagenome]
MHHIGILKEVTNNGMTRFVESHYAFLTVTDYTASFFGTYNNTVNSFIYFTHRDIFPITTSS